MKNMRVLAVYCMIIAVVTVFAFWSSAPEAQQTDYVRIVRATAADFTGWNPILPIGTIGFETDTRKSKMGDGNTPWTSLAYMYFAPADASDNLTTTGTFTAGGFRTTGSLEAGSASLTTPLPLASGGTGVTSRFTTTTFSAPTYTGQLAIVGANAYIATSNTATTDWKQISN